MPIKLSEKALEMLADMPPYEADTEETRTVIAVQANEFERIEAAAMAIQAAMFPTQAADVELLDGAGVARVLSMWETMLGLPVAPEGITVAERRSKVRAHILKRQAGSGLEWAATLTEALGTNVWSYEEGPTANTVTIRIPYGGTSYSGGQVLALAREITPAHVEVDQGTVGGFLVGISLVGVDAI